MTVRKEKGRATFNLADDGPGVPEEALGRLLEAFYRTDKARSRTENGSGLGLAIVNRAASLMHGEIKVENRKPHGLSFTFISIGGGTMTKRILIVEDDDDIASIEKDYLEVSGYEVHVEDGARGAFRSADGHL